MPASIRPLAVTIGAAVAVVFGVITIASGGRALFAGVDMGAVVPFVLWFNFAAGFFYVLAGIGLWLQRDWGRILALGIFAATLLVLLAFAVHVARGGSYEMRTVGAMVLRAAVWAGIALAAARRRQSAPSR